MTSKDNQEIIRKIKRCMELTKSANEHESAMAFKQMQALMKKYGLTEQHALASDVTQAIFELSIKQRVPKWIFELHVTISQALDCESIVTTGGEGNAKLMFVGVGASPEIANYSFEVLFRQLKAGRAKFITEHTGELPRAKKTQLADAYCEGWIISVYRKVKNLSPNQDIKEKIKAYTETVDLNWGDGSGAEGVNRNKRKSKASDRAMQMGFDDSVDVNLHVATGNKSQTLIGDSDD